MAGIRMMPDGGGVRSSPKDNKPKDTKSSGTKATPNFQNQRAIEAASRRQQEQRAAEARLKQQQQEQARIRALQEQAREQERQRQIRELQEKQRIAGEQRAANRSPSGLLTPDQQAELAEERQARIDLGIGSPTDKLYANRDQMRRQNPGQGLDARGPLNQETLGEALNRRAVTTEGANLEDRRAPARGLPKPVDSPFSFREMTWDEYNLLDADTRAAVDFNGLLRDAVDKDRKIQTSMNDRNKDGRISMSEVSDSRYKRYSDAAKNVFGQRDEDLTYAPNTVALLNSMGVKDLDGQIGEYLNDRGFIQDEDIRQGLHKTNMQVSVGGDPVTAGRAQWLTEITRGMKRLESTLAKGRQMLAGTESTPTLGGNITDTQRSTFVDQLTNSLAQDTLQSLFTETGEFNIGSGVDVTNLLDANLVEQDRTMQSIHEAANAWLAEAGAQQGTLYGDEWLTDKSFIGNELARQGIDMSAWKRYLEAKKNEPGSVAEVLNGEES